MPACLSRGVSLAVLLGLLIAPAGARADVGDDVRRGYGEAIGWALALRGPVVAPPATGPCNPARWNQGWVSAPRVERAPAHRASHPYPRRQASRRLAAADATGSCPYLGR